jgi:ribosomal 50S subunit-recycling heat shock protein
LRLDVFLKRSRIVPRRTLARATCDAGRVEVNGASAKASLSLRLDDVVSVRLSSRTLRFRVRSLPERAPGKAQAAEMIEMLADAGEGSGQ